jgi:uridine kinase
VTGGRAAVLDELVARILAVRVPHPVRVAIDGPDAAGKTTLARELAVRIRAAGRPVLRASGDDFAHPAAVRHRRGRDDPDGYRLDTLDEDALREALLVPLGPGGDRRCRTRAWDLAADRPVRARARLAPAATVLLVDGVFLGGPRLRGLWELRAWVAVSPETVLRRALVRDVPRLGSRAEVERRYRQRYLPAQAAYAALDRAAATADVVVHNDDPQDAWLEVPG